MPVVLPKEVVLTLENHQLKMQAVSYKLRIQQQEITNLMREKAELEAGIQELRKNIQGEFGVDITKINILSDGTILETPVQP